MKIATQLINQSFAFMNDYRRQFWDKTTIIKEKIPLLTKKQCKQGHMPMKLEDLDAIQTIYTMVKEVCNDSERHNDDRCQWHSKYHWRKLSKNYWPCGSVMYGSCTRLHCQKYTQKYTKKMIVSLSLVVIKYEKATTK